MAKKKGTVRYLQGVFDTATRRFLGISDPNTSGDGVDYSIAVTQKDDNGNVTAILNDDGSRRYSFENTYVAETVADIQAGNDWLVSVGGGELHFLPSTTYTWSASDTTKTINTGYVTVRFNRSKHNIAALPDGTIAFKFVDTTTGPTDSHRQREISDFYIYAPMGEDSSTGAIAFSLDSPTSDSSNRVQFVRGKVIRCKAAISLGSRSYFASFRDCEFAVNYVAVQDTVSPSDYAERVNFENCVFGDNTTHVKLSYGQIVRMNNCSLDYHKSRFAELAGGSQLFLSNAHLEWSYGESVSETNTPVTLTDSNTAFVVEGNSNIVYAGSGANPYYTSFISCNNSNQRVIVEAKLVSNMGRVGDTTSVDSLVTVTGSVSPYIRCELDGNNSLSSNLPTMTAVAETYGLFGLLRNGIDDPFNEMSNKIATTGTAAVSSVSASENGVTLKNGKKMIKITGQGKVTIAFPYKITNRRNAWVFFTNPAYVTGTVTIKERLNGFAPKFDGTTVSWVADTKTVTYASSTATITAGSDVWTRRSWRDFNTRCYPTGAENMANSTLVEIDTTSMTAGALYLSYFGFDTM